VHLRSLTHASDSRVKVESLRGEERRKGKEGERELRK